jgi:hypothetical protein
MVCEICGDDAVGTDAGHACESSGGTLTATAQLTAAQSVSAKPMIVARPPLLTKGRWRSAAPAGTSRPRLPAVWTLATIVAVSFNRANHI